MSHLHCRLYNYISFCVSIINTQSIEWPVWTDATTRKRKPGKTNIIQLHTPAEDKESYYLFEVGSFSSTRTFLTLLSNLFSRRDILLIGANHKGDLTRLKNDFDGDFMPDEDQVHLNLRDVQEMAQNRGVVIKSLGRSLKALCSNAGYYLPKPEHIRCGPILGSRKNLPDDAKRYCMRDLVALKILYDKYSLMPILTHRLQDKDVIVGMEVDVMPKDRMNSNPIARGIVVPTDGTSEKLTKNKIKLKTASGMRRFLIKISNIFDLDGVLHYARVGNQKCACGRLRHGDMRETCNMYSYGQIRNDCDDDFKVVEESCRLRKSVITIPTTDGAKQNHTRTVECRNTTFANVHTVAAYEDDDSAKSFNDESGDEESGDLNLDDDENEQLFVDAASALAADLASEENTFKHMLDEQMEHALGEEADGENQESIDTYESSTTENNPTSYNEDTIRDEADNISLLFTNCDEWCKETFGLRDEDFQYDTNEVAVDGYLDVSKDMILSRVLGDAFHVMDRVKVPVNHCYKAAYFMALREAIFIMNPEVVNNLRDAYGIDNNDWKRKLAFDFQFIAKRVRHRIPPPKILHARVNAVYNYFQDKKDFNTDKPLFNVKAKEKACNILKMIQLGFISDPPGISFYVQLFDAHDGTPKLDQKGLQLYRSIRGTSLVESFHELLTRSFGHTQAGPYYSDCLLTLVRHTHNWRASMRNRPGFPQLHHYDGEAIDIVNDLHEFCFAQVKYPNWIGADKGRLSPDVSPYGIVTGLNASVVSCPKAFQNSKDYIAF